MISERIRAARKNAKLTQQSLGKLIGVTKATISQWEGGQTAPNGENLTKLAKALGSTADWIVSGEEPILTNAESISSIAMGIPSKGKIRLAGEALMGVDGAIDLLADISGVLNFYSPDVSAYAIRIKGDSLWPRINNGEFVVVSPSKAVLPGDEVYIVTKDNRIYIKKLGFIKNDSYLFTSINQTTPPMTMNADDLESIHQISAILKSDYFEP